MGPSISLTLRHSLSRRRSACRSLPLHPCPRCKAQPHTHQGAVQTSSQSDDSWWNCRIFQKHDDAQRNPSLEVLSSLNVPIEKKKKLWEYQRALHMYINQATEQSNLIKASCVQQPLVYLLAYMPLQTVSQCAVDTTILKRILTLMNKECKQCTYAPKTNALFKCCQHKSMQHNM